MPDTLASLRGPVSCRRGAAPLGLTLIGETSRSEEHTSELQSQSNLVCRLLLEKKKTQPHPPPSTSTSAFPRPLSPYHHLLFSSSISTYSDTEPSVTIYSTAYSASLQSCKWSLR